MTADVDLSALTYPPLPRDPNTPPSPIWADDATGLTVWVNGGLVEIDMGGSFARLLPDEMPVDLAAEFAHALVAAQWWARRWVRADTYPYTGSYSVL